MWRYVLIKHIAIGGTDLVAQHSEIDDTKNKSVPNKTGCHGIVEIVTRLLPHP